MNRLSCGSNLCSCLSYYYYRFFISYLFYCIVNLPKRPDQALLWAKAGPLSIFVSREEPLFFSKGAIGTVNGRLKRKATSYPSRVEREGCFLFCLFFSSHFGRPRSRSLSSPSIPQPLCLL